MQSLSTLQNQMKRDPVAFRDEFKRLLRHFEAQVLLIQDSTLQEHQAAKRESAKNFQKLASFLPHVSSLFPEDGGGTVPSHLVKLLDSNAELDPDLRMKLFQALVLLRNR